MKFSVVNPDSMLCLARLATVALAIALAFVWPPAASAEIDPLVLDAQAQRVAVLANAREAAIAIFAPGGQGGGSGVVISPDGYALSNFHVTKGAGDAMKCGMAHGGLYDAVIVGFDPVGDVALLKLLGREDFPHAGLGDSDQVRLGDWVYAVGNPFLLATDFSPTVTYGIVSGVHRYQYPAGTLLEYTDCIQTDAAINPGNSGGPLFDSQGLVIGINGRGSFEKRGRVSVGAGYAISINQIKNFLGHLRAGRIVDHATLGATVASRDDGRVIVNDILENCDAYRRGLRLGDELVSFAGRPIQTVNAFKNALGIFPYGWRVPLSYRRQGRTFDVIVRLERVHGVEELLEKVQGRQPLEPPQPKPKPLPRPDKKPGDPPGDDPGRQPGDPLPAAGPHNVAMPEVVREHFEVRRGFANYFFNRLNRDRVWRSSLAQGDFSPCTLEWTLRGQLVGAGDALFRISDTQSACELPGGKLTQPIGDSLTQAADPPGSGGLLTALYLWRRLMVFGPERFGSLDYLGFLPLATADEMAEAFEGTYGGVECQFLFDRETGLLLSQETFLRGSDDDPCELLFFDYRLVDGRQLPGRLVVKYGDSEYGEFRLDEIVLPTQAPPAVSRSKTRPRRLDSAIAGDSAAPFADPTSSLRPLSYSVAR